MAGSGWLRRCGKAPPARKTPGEGEARPAWLAEGQREGSPLNHKKGVPSVGGDAIRCGEVLSDCAPARPPGEGGLAFESSSFAFWHEPRRSAPVIS